MKQNKKTLGCQEGKKKVKIVDHTQKAREGSRKEDLPESVNCGREARRRAEDCRPDLARRSLLSPRRAHGTGREERTRRTHVTGGPGAVERRQRAPSAH